MDLKALDANLSVTGQILPEDVPAIAAAGFKSIICNRPDGESEDQPAYAAVEAAARAAGLTVVYQPVVSSQLNDRDAQTFGEIFDRLPKPVLAYCRSGARCTRLFEGSRKG
ncbi:MAG: TIGR01244 family sulfur transferase [Alphaproteobacteria bacterium]